MRRMNRQTVMITALFMCMLAMTIHITAAEPHESAGIGIYVTTGGDRSSVDISLRVKGSQLDGIAHVMFRYDPDVLSISDTEPRIHADWKAVGNPSESLSAVTYFDDGYTALTVVSNGELGYESYTDIVTLTMNVLDSEKLDSRSIRLVHADELSFLHHAAVLSLGGVVISDRYAPDGVSPLQPEFLIYPENFGICTHENKVHHPAVSAGCMTVGSKAYLSCTSCGKYSMNNGSVWSDTIDSVIRPLGHKTELVGVKIATEHENGYTGDTYCRRCEKHISYGTVIPKRESGIAPGFYRPPVCAVRLELGMTDINVHDAMHLNAGAVLNLDAFIPSREGYVFNGWYADPACTEPLTGDYLVTQAATLYADWIELPAGIPSLEVLMTNIRSIFERWLSVFDIPVINVNP